MNGMICSHLFSTINALYQRIYNTAQSSLCFHSPCRDSGPDKLFKDFEKLHSVFKLNELNMLEISFLRRAQC